LKDKTTSFRYCFTIDTEPDNLWEFQPRCSFESFKKLSGFHSKLTAAGARPTYLTTSEVVESSIGRSALENCLSMGMCEIGAHFHTWTREWPFAVPNLRKPPIMAMGHRLGEMIEEQMLTYTCGAISKALGIEPKSYRGGRWSLGHYAPSVLAKCGISVDSTVTPGLSWRDYTDRLTDGSDFRDAPMYPHLLNNSSTTNADHSIIELPVGTAPFPRCANAVLRTKSMQRIARSIGNRIGVRIGYHWLRPTDTSAEDMRAVMLALKQQGCAVWVFMIHSSEIIPCNPLPSQRDVQAMIDRCVKGIRIAIELGAQPATLTEAALLVQNNNSPTYYTLHDIPY
jgi:hypothetical protein